MKRIIIKNLNKEFNLSRRENESVLRRVISMARALVSVLTSGKRHPSPKIRVAKDITFEVEAGRNVGVIGRNGSGKSTLLRLIAGIYVANSGEIKTEGSLVYLAGFGLGIQPLLTMRENIYLMSALLGLSTAEIKVRFEEIVEFSELKDFVETPVYQFSSGMTARLNFSVMIFCLHQRKPDILLLDEVLSGAGDIDFQKKAIAKMEEFIRGGATVVLVSHDLSIIERYCDSVILLQDGEIRKIGGPKEIVEMYSKL